MNKPSHNSQLSEIALYWCDTDLRSGLRYARSWADASSSQEADVITATSNRLAIAEEYIRQLARALAEK